MDPIAVGGRPLDLRAIVAVARHRAPVALTAPRAGLLAGRQALEAAVAAGTPVYGMTTRLGALVDHEVTAAERTALVEHILAAHATGLGDPIPADEVRATMLLRLNVLALGVSGVRPVLLERLAEALNEGRLPEVPALGSIGASGDLVPLSYIARAILPPDADPRELLALINGTSASTATAVLALADARTLFGAHLAVHALAFEALRGDPGVLHPFLHQQKPHRGQGWVAERLRELLAGSRWATSGARTAPLQDRYSLRCLPQYLGPGREVLARAEEDVLTEANSATDNPLIDPGTGAVHHGGNFLGEYVALAMDGVRQQLALWAQALDLQVAHLMAPEFSRGLPPSLVPPSGGPSLGLKGVQLAGNSILPLILHRAGPITQLFPTHAEQFNQVLNSQSWNSARLTVESLTLARQHLAIGLVVASQAVALRAGTEGGGTDPRPWLAPGTRRLYEAVRANWGVDPSGAGPLIADERAQRLDHRLTALADDLRQGGPVRAVLQDLGLAPSW